MFRRDGMNRRHEVVQRSALGLLILFSGLFAPALIMSEPRAGSHVGRDDRRPVHTLDARRHDSD